MILEMKSIRLIIDYKASWVKEYLAVEVSTMKDGKLVTAKGGDHQLTTQQKDLLKTADPGADILVKVDYVPANNLVSNEPKSLEFTVAVRPEKEATFSGGKTAMNKYFQDDLLSKIPDGTFKGYDVVAVKFTVSEEGEIQDVHLFGEAYRPFENEDMKSIILKSVSEMPCWNPARFDNGQTEAETYVFNIGNMENCMVGLLNIHRD